MFVSIIVLLMEVQEQHCERSLPWGTGICDLLHLLGVPLTTAVLAVDGLGET